MQPTSTKSASTNSVSTNPAACNCLALRQATRHVTQFYDQFISPLWLRATQYSILARLHRRGAMTINALAAELVMDRTTLGRNILPLQRDGLIAIAPGKSDRRSKDVRLTPKDCATISSEIGAPSANSPSMMAWRSRSRTRCDNDFGASSLNDFIGPSGLAPRDGAAGRNVVLLKLSVN